MRMAFLIAATLSAVPMAARAQMSAPVLSPDSAKRLHENYPRKAVHKGKSAAALVDLWSDARGQIYKCDLVGSAGDERLAGSVCELMKRVRLSPAEDDTGQPVTGRLRTLIKLSVPGTEEAKMVEEMVERPDLELTVNKLPGDAKTLEFDLAIAVEPMGQVRACEAASDAPSAYADVACDRVRAIEMPVGTGPDGTPQAYVTDAKARFVAPDGADQ